MNWVISVHPACITRVSKTSIHRPIMGPTLTGPFMEAFGLGRYIIITMILYG